MGTIETFDHTADVGFRIQGTDLTDLFITAAEGLFDYVVANRQDVLAVETEPIALEADDPAELFLAWLSELIFRVETKHRLYSAFAIEVNPDGRSLHGTLAGEPIDPTRHELDHEVKAVTRHGFHLDQTPNGWNAEAILDI